MTDLIRQSPWGDVALLQNVARGYALRLGCEAFPVMGKKPALGYEWGENALGAPGLHKVTTAAWEMATGYALAPVAGSNLVILESDDPTLTQWVLDLLPTFKSRQPPLHVRRGENWHFYLTLTCPLPKAYLDLRDDDGQHVGSLRGVGAYVVGPHSVHPSGEIYKAYGNTPLAATEQRTSEILAQFGARGPKSPGDPLAGKKPAWDREGREPLRERPDIAPVKDCGISPRIVADLLDHFQRAGYRSAFDEERGIWWLNGTCPNAANHKHGDRHASFGFNTRGVGYCFVCGPMRAVDLCKLVGIALPERRPAPVVRQRERRADLVAAGYTRAVRFMDRLPAIFKRLDKSGQVQGKNRRRFTVGEALAGFLHIGWKRARFYRDLGQAVEAGLLARVAAGKYEIAERFEEPSPSRPSGPAFNGHPVNYRRTLLERVERQLQPEEPSAVCPSAATIAWHAGLQERTLYRYESVLHIQRLQVYRRSALPTVDGPDGSPVAVAPTDHLDWDRPTAYRRFEVVQPGQGTIRRIPLGRWPGQALDQALAIAEEWQAVVLLSERRPSIRVLPGQRLWDRVPLDARLTDDCRGVTVDAPSAARLLVLPPTPSEDRDSDERARRVARKPGRRAALSNDSDLSDKHEIQGDLLHRQTSNLPGRGSADGSQRWRRPPFIVRRI